MGEVAQCGHHLNSFTVKGKFEQQKPKKKKKRIKLEKLTRRLEKCLDMNWDGELVVRMTFQLRVGLHETKE